MKDRVILHCDLNNFFASVSLVFNPTLKDMPVAVCGDKENRHGIILAKNEIAKKFGVKTAEPIFEAKRKCPDLVTLPAIYDKYEEYSKKAQEIYRRYTDMVEPFGIDECWLDVTGSVVLFGSGEEIAFKIKEDIKKELGITASVGVSFNKVFAKLGSDMKKPDAITLISRENFKGKIWNLPISDLLFVGNKTKEKLKSVGVRTIGEITFCTDESLKKLLGKNGLELKAFALGEDRSPVVTPSFEDKPKSVGKSVTRGTDFTNEKQVWQEFLSFGETICATLREKELYASGVQVHIRTTSLKVQEFSKSFSETTNCSLTFAKWGFELFKENYNFSEPLRSVGLRAINLKTEHLGGQLDLFGEKKDDTKTEKADKSLYDLRRKFGKEKLKRGRNI
ncbi:MAG: DNA polymerase IV [Clostridia bacterium]|nr:DNA polymerase IV [Clostridia bacterium]